MSVKKIDKAYLNFILTLSVLVAMYLISKNWENQLMLHDVKVYDASILNDNEVKALAAVKAGTALFGLRLAQVSGRIEQNPFVKQAVVVRALPYDLTITLRERNPVALLAMAEPSGMLSVDEDGVVLPVPLGRRNGLPLITDVTEEIARDFNRGLAVGDTLSGTLMQAVRFICCADKIGPWLSADIAEVELDGNSLIAYTTTSSLPVIIGNGELHRKVIYLQSFLKQVAGDGDPSYKYVDLRFDGEIVIGQDTETMSYLPKAKTLVDRRP